MEWNHPPEELSEHVVLCNASAHVRRIVAELHTSTVRRRPRVVLVLQDEALWDHHPEWHPSPKNEFTRENFFVLRVEGGPAKLENLQRAGICTARAAVILADPRQEGLADARSTLVALSIERLSPEVHTVMELTSSTNRPHLEATEVNEVVCASDMAEKLIAQSCITPGVKNVFHNLLTTAPDTCRFFTMSLPKAVVGISYRELGRRAIQAAAPFVLCGFIRHSFLPTAPAAECAELGEGPAALVEARSQKTMVLNPRHGVEPGRDTPLGESDQLIVMAYTRPVLERYLIPPGA